MQYLRSACLGLRSSAFTALGQHHTWYFSVIRLSRIKMPLQEAELPAEVAALATGQNCFLVFFSSRMDGKLWCPDCVAVENLINETFAPESSPFAVLVYVGQKAEWKSQDNIFRKDPWCLTSIPTIVRLNDAGEEISRLVEDDLLDPIKFSSFVQSHDA